MKVAIFGSIPQVPPHFEIQLNILQNLLDNGHEVTFLGCNGSRTSFCLQNPTGNHWQCWICRSRRKAGINAARGLIKEISIDNLIDNLRLQPDSTNFEVARDTDSLRLFKWESFDAGEASASYLMSLFKETRFNVLTLKETTHRALISSIQVYLALRAYLNKERFDKVVIFNGRFPLERAAIRACQETNTPFSTTEGGSEEDKYIELDNNFPHDIDFWKNGIKSLWETSLETLEEKSRIGHLFFSRQKSGQGQFTRPEFREHQQAGNLPSGWLDIPQSSRVSLFLSSDYERQCAIGWPPMLFFAEQEAYVSFIIQELQKRRFDGILSIRFHPNSHPECIPFEERLESLGLSFLKVIRARDSIDTYSLAETSGRAASFGSTVGIEAAYMGRPVILLDRSTYEDLDICSIPDSPLHAVDLLMSDLPAKPQLGCLKWAYFMQRFGTSLKHITKDHRNRLLFNGQRVKSNSLLTQFLYGLKLCEDTSETKNRLVSEYWNSHAKQNSGTQANTAV